MNPNEHVHCGWLCISQDSRRVEEAEFRLLKALSKYLPVVVVITKAGADQGFFAPKYRAFFRRRPMSFAFVRSGRPRTTVTRCCRWACRNSSNGRCR